MKKLILSAVALSPSVIACSPEEKPNVILILTDDQGWGDLRVNGNEQINTPNLDKLRAESAVLDQFYVCPLSAPTRASLLTGRYHLRTGVSAVEGGLENLRPEESLTSLLLRKENPRYLQN